VVGVDGSSSSQRALEWAVREAEVHGNTVLAISTYSIPTMAIAESGFALESGNLQELADYCRDVLATQIAEVSDGHSSVRIEPKVVHGPAAQVLIDASDSASTLVVGSRGHGGFIGLLLGSVSQQCVSHAHCPVVVVRTSEAGAEPPVQSPNPGSVS
jgi:nucleotide-binding universal stress UspA family protein